MTMTSSNGSGNAAPGMTSIAQAGPSTGALFPPGCLYRMALTDLQPLQEGSLVGKEGLGVSTRLHIGGLAGGTACRAQGAREVA